MISIRDLDRLSYDKACTIQNNLHQRRMNDTVGDTLLFVEHDPVYTLGKNANHNNLLNTHSTDVDVVQTDRGGDITWHGPGQLVGYPILDLRGYKLNVKSYMNALEDVLINTLDRYGIKATRKAGLTGVWVDDNKIAALGVKISRWITMHGFALNVQPDLSYYKGIIPCGISGYGVTSMEQILGSTVEMETVKTLVSEEFNRVFSLMKRA
ncbi:MAG: lipoyl(octanoyl) transferase LipB [Candidatus Marinimicrobia bacterium]|nr:lipoyl(octanoyl) transferase LipB [Candidatus Neomarinimicrobiota bacterium]MBL7059999.1 lipoyl(octanoyl) transferase LipB [Candidatus Neomarinimicrobiota bacterium]